MTEPIKLLTERYNEIKQMRKSAFVNSNTEDLESLKKLEVLYYSSIEYLQALRVNFTPTVRVYELTTIQIQDIIDNCRTGLKNDDKNSTTSFARKYNITTKSVANILRRNKDKKSA